MEITNVNKKGTTRVSDDIRIKYNMSVDKSEKVSAMTANIVKGDTIVGFYNVSANVVLGLSFRDNNELTTEEMKQIFDNAINDSVEILNK